MSDKLVVFVYGTLKPGEKNYPTYCENYVFQVRPAIVKGILYDLPIGYPAITWGEGWVQGVLLNFHQNQILAKLDDLEDYNPERPSEYNEYQRCWIEVFSLEYNFLGYAWAYFMAIDRIHALQGKPILAGLWTGHVSD